MKNKKELIEKLADIEHQRWAHWMRYFWSKCISISPVYYEGESERISFVLEAEDFERWNRQMETDYKDLSEKEKQSDRDQVMKYLPTIEEYYKD